MTKGGSKAMTKHILAHLEFPTQASLETPLRAMSVRRVGGNG